jgi:hypothetical protein
MQPNTIESILARFITDPISRCWVWTGLKTKDGYGRVRFKGRFQRSGSSLSFDVDHENEHAYNPADDSEVVSPRRSETR